MYLDTATILERMMEALSCETQSELASFLGVQQPCVSIAVRKGSIPSNWLLTLVKKAHLNPDWVLYGDEYGKYLIPSESAEAYIKPSSYDTGVALKSLLKWSESI